MGQLKTTLRSFLAIIFILLIVLGCHPKKMTRPYGSLRLSPLSRFVASETYLEDKRFLVFRDERGLSAMSTLCTYDLSPLTMLPDGTWKSEYSDSKYSHTGAVLSGPATESLPFYELVVDSDDIGKPKDFLFVRVGNAVSIDWKLPIVNQ